MSCFICKGTGHYQRWCGQAGGRLEGNYQCNCPKGVEWAEAIRDNGGMMVEIDGTLIEDEG